AEPLAPAIALGGFNAWPKMRTGDVGERPDAEWAGVALVDVPRRKQNLRNRAHHLRAVAEGQANPFAGDFSRAQVRVPGQTPIPIQIRHGQRMRKPVFVEAYVNDSIEAAE